MNKRRRLTIYRMQDRDGRGPFRSGSTKQWRDPDRKAWLPSWMEEFGPLIFIPGRIYGTGTLDLHGLRRWFTPTEQARLESFGFQAVMMEVNRIVAQSTNQVVFERRLALTTGFTVIRWLMP